MFTGDEDVEATALRKQGWSISAIARHLGRSRDTVRAHLNGTREAGVRQTSGLDPFDRFEPYTKARLSEDPHV
jgi:IS30 family transposase